MEPPGASWPGIARAPAKAPEDGRKHPYVPATHVLLCGAQDVGARHKALVRADGAISLGETVGSIHRIGALAQGLDACNGWAFWHLETAKGLVSIDLLRAEIRAGMPAA